MSQGNAENPQNSNSPPSRWTQLYEKARQKWDDRPSAFEMHFYYIPMAIFAGALVVAAIDEQTDLDIAQTMYNVQVDPTENVVERTIDDIIHKIGASALDYQKE